MKKSIKRILACILCGICLASSFLVFMLEPSAASPLGYGFNIFDGATASVKMNDVYRDDGSYVTSTVNLAFDLTSGDLLFRDTVYYTTRNKVAFGGLGDLFYSYYTSGIGCTSATVTITLAEPQPFNYTWIYCTDPSLNPAVPPVNTVSDIEIVAEDPSGNTVYIDAFYGIQDTLRPQGAGIAAYIDYMITGITFDITPTPTFPSISAQMLDLAAYFSDFEGGSFQMWGDDGAYYYINYDYQAQTEYIRQESYGQGYNAGLVNGKETGHASGYTEGYDAGYSVGSAESGQIWYDDGYARGQSDGLSEGFDNGYDSGYAAGESIGWSKGFQAGHTTDLDLSMGGLFAELVGAPVKVVVSTLNFDFLGLNMSGFFRGLLTLALLIAITVTVIKVFI